MYKVYWAEHSSVDELRDVATSVLSSRDSSQALVVNYHMGALGVGPDRGHWSPLAAYHAPTDR